MKTLFMILGLVGVLMASDGKTMAGKCVACHGVSFEKVALGKSAVLKGQKAEVIEASLLAYKAGTQNRTGMGALMKGQMATLSATDIKSIAQYIASVK